VSGETGATFTIRVLGAGGGQSPGQDLTGFLLGREVLLDAGTIGLQLTLDEQRQIRHVLLTHGHLDHHHALPFLLDNLIGRVPGSVNIYCLPEVMESLRRHIFNGAIWPDFTRLPTPEAPIANLRPITPGQPFSAGDFTVEAVRVEHSVPAVAYILRNAAGSVVFSGDTGPTEALWQRLRHFSDLRAIFLETSFPAAQSELSALTRHLNTEDVRREVAKIGLSRPVPLYLYHLKPEYAGDIAREAEGWAHVLRTGEEVRVTRPESGA